MIDFSISKDEYYNDLAELVRPFEQQTPEAVSLCLDYINDGSEFKVTLTSDKFQSFKKIYRFQFSACDEMERKRMEKRFLKVALYRTLVFLTGVNLPYGCLSGIRPTKLFTEIQSEPEKYDGMSARDVFLKEYGVSASKVALIERTAQVQSPLRNRDENAFDVFVFIPFCPTKCAYCSFVSLPLQKQRKLVEPYVDCLIRELENTKKLVRMRKYKIRSVYVGGGTPTSIGAPLLDKVLSHCHFKASEFTVEAGRPDTISPEIVKVMQKHKVTRVSVNPQTFNDATLERIGRCHRSSDIVEAYGLVKGKFDVNMDLIAMLPGETVDDFKRSVDTAIALSPENITVHTLYLKKGSALKNANYDNADYSAACAMVDYACQKLCGSGYAPYYMYRQKYTSGNLENVGYAKPGKECIYNIDVMEEDTSVLANGAAAISKKWTPEKNLIQRCANYKEPLEYIKHFDNVLEKQNAFWSE